MAKCKVNNFNEKDSNIISDENLYLEQDISSIVTSLSEESSSEYKIAYNDNLGTNYKTKPSRYLKTISIIAIIISLIIFTNTHNKIYHFIVNVEKHSWGPFPY